MSLTNLKVALAGNPNSGKTSIFNALTGSHHNVGNYPGVTVEKKEGFLKYQDYKLTVLDLPGTYSLTSFSPEERIARREILSGQYDVAVVVVDSTNLKRNLFLLTQIMLASANPVLCLNMTDEAEKSGQKIDIKQMKQLLGFPIVQTVGNRGIGIEDLKKAIVEASMQPIEDHRLVYSERLGMAVNQLAEMLEDDPLPDKRPSRWLAIKVLEADEPAMEWIGKRFADKAQEISDLAKKLAHEIEEETELDVATYVADQHYGFAAGLIKEVIVIEANEDTRALSDRIDAVLCHKLFGPFFFFGAMYLLFYITFSIGDYPMSLIELVFKWLGEFISGFWPEGDQSALRSLLVDGIIAGVGGVVIFLPNIALLFLGLAFFEDSGYMARAAFLVDKVMHSFGLHGKSFIPMMTGFGCTIPGIMATRTLENERDRLTTIMVLPLISCGARLPIWMLLIPAFFPDEFRAPILFAIYLIGILLAVLLAKLLRSTLLKGEDAPFVMELPPYRMPTFKALASKVGERSWLYVRKAGTIILGISILLWVISSYPKPESFEIDHKIAQGTVKVVENIDKNAKNATKNTSVINNSVMTEKQVEQVRASESLNYSVAGRLGQVLEIFTAPMGFDVPISTALIGSFAAKEVFVSQMSIVFSLGDEESSRESLRKKLQERYSPLIAFSLMIFLLIATPCMATIAVTKRECGSWKWAMFQLFGLTGLAWILSTMIYQIGSLFD